MRVFDEAGQEVREDAQSLFICFSGMNPEEGLRLQAAIPTLASSQYWAPMLPLNLPLLRELLTLSVTGQRGSFLYLNEQRAINLSFNLKKMLFTQMAEKKSVFLFPLCLSPVTQFYPG